MVPFWGAVVGYIVLSLFVRRVRVFKYDIDLPGPGMALAQTVLATVDVAATAAIFYALLPAAEGLTFLRFVGIYLAAYAAGILAHVPGGLGVFDGAIMLGLQPYMPAAEVVGALLVFRLYYYVVPLFISGLLFAGFEIGQRRGVLERFTAVGRGTDALEVPAIASLVALVGALLLFMGALPVRNTIVDAWAGRAAALASHFAASVVGSLLLVMAFGLMRRLSIAWWGSLLLLLNAAGIVWVRGESWWLWGSVLLVAALLASLRSAFYRDARLTREPLSDQALVPLVAVAVCGITLALVAYSGGRFSEESWWEVVLTRDAPASLRFTVGLTGVLLLVGMVRLLRPVRLGVAAWDDGARHRLRSLGALAPRAGRRRRVRREGAGGLRLPQARQGVARARRPGGRAAGRHLRDLAIPRRVRAGGRGPGLLARRPGPLAHLRGHRDDGGAAGRARTGSAALPGVPGRARPPGVAPAPAAGLAAGAAARDGGRWPA